MILYYRIDTHIHEGIGPGFPDREVTDGITLKRRPFPGSKPVQVEEENDPDPPTR